MLKKFFLRNENTIFLVALMAVLCMVSIPMFIGLTTHLANPVVNPYFDSDWAAVNRGLDGIHSFKDTGRWWTGNWAGPFRYWRPLMSYTWLGLAHVWKPGDMLSREYLLFALHIIYLVMCGYFLYKLTGRKWLALFAIYIYAGYVPTMFGDTSASVTALLSDPKNIPDPIAGICIVGSLLLLLDEKYYLAIIPACLGTLFKEIAFVVWGVAPVVLFITKRWRRVPVPAIALWAGSVIMLCVAHYLAVGTGYRMSGNSSWYIRMVSFHFGTVVMSFLSTNPGAPLLSVMLILAVKSTWKKSPILVLLGIFGAFAFGSILEAVLFRCSIAEGFACLVDSELGLIIYTTIWLSIFFLARKEFLSALPYLIMAIIAAIPTWVALQVLAHTRYESDLFASMFMAIILSGAAKSVWGAYEDFVAKKSVRNEYKQVG